MTHGLHSHIQGIVGRAHHCSCSHRGTMFIEEQIAGHPLDRIVQRRPEHEPKQRVHGAGSYDRPGRAAR